MRFNRLPILSFFVGILTAILPLAPVDAQSASRPGICFLNGADGMNPLFFTEVPDQLRALYGIEFKALDMGARGDIQTRSQRFVLALKRILAKRPNFSCHLYAYSMGGVVARYSFAKHKIIVGAHERKWDSLFPSMTTFATPHRGTPIADLIGEFFPNMQGRGLETLSERALKNVNDEKSPEYWPMPKNMRVYSYLSYLGSRQEAASFAHKIIYDFILKDSKQRGLDPRNDGMVPLRSQSFGTVVGSFKVPHSYFGYDSMLLPFFKLTTVDLFRTQWECLEYGHSELADEFRKSDFYESANSGFCNAKNSSAR